ncbi:Uncharacterized protein dnl_06160 [Desulfonema limicola]|uniref:Uncharacterized protein n=1 Tax=Desulfonema limicola TaxID=45656 RepID=A0A975B414_9BACT|nr:hypothetical protein [Desulfonema limicola]QTA78394.1 Uncharacterized protein dnl_06160 [Desulfonema limicola]
MKFKDLSTETIEKIRSYRWDRIIEKHEGPEPWDSTLKYNRPEFMDINGYHVLLPLSPKHYPNITILRVLSCDDGNVLTIFLKDTTYYDSWLDSGFVTVCEKFPGEDFYLSVLYHEWFIIENPKD